MQFAPDSREETYRLFYNFRTHRGDGPMIVFRTGDDKDSLAGLVHEVAGSSPVGGATTVGAPELSVTR